MLRQIREQQLRRGPVQTHQAALVDYPAVAVIKKYTGVLAADVHTASTAFILLESIRLERGFGSQIHP